MIRDEIFIRKRCGKKGLTFQVRLKDNEGKEISKSFNQWEFGTAQRAFDEAVMFRNKTLIDIKTNEYLPKCKLTVEEVFEDYIETTTDAYTTKDKHVKLFKKYCKHKTTPIQDLTKGDILADLNAMVKVASDDTIQRVCSIYRNDVVMHALNNEYINRDVIAGIKCPASRLLTTKKSTETDRPTILEVERLIFAKLTDKYVARLIYYLIEILYYTGMRPAEAEALTRSDIHETYISVNKQLGSDDEKVGVLTKCKTDMSVRNIPINPMLRPILNELLDFAYGEELFVNKDGYFINSSYIGSIIRRVTSGTGIKFNLYRLRHYVATELITNSVDTKTTMAILGHANYNMSLSYANSSEELKSEAIKLLS